MVDDKARPPRIVATVEARMSSRRLPGKMLMPVLGQPILQFQLNRIRQIPSIEQVVLATTVNEADAPLASLAQDLGISHFRGSEDDVMGRVIGAAESAGADIVVEFTGDCPLVDPEIVEQSIQLFLHNTCDYFSTGHVSSYPEGVGDCQVFYLDALVKSAAMTSDPEDREHVTIHMKKHPDLFRLMFHYAPAGLHWPELDLNLDVQADFELIRRVVEHFGPTRNDFGCRQIIELLRENPEWLELNRDVERTKVNLGRNDDEEGR